MADKKIIAVVGATGSQGGGLVRAILADADGPFAVRAITRNADSAKAQELAAAGAEVVEANLADEATIRGAFDGAYGAFVVTNFWEQRTPEEDAAQTRADMELTQAQNAAKAAKAAGVQHVIWSTLEDTRTHLPVSDDRVPTLDGKYTVPHFDAKADANKLFSDLGVPTTNLQTTFYFEAFLQGMGPQRGEDGQLVLTLPMSDAKLPGIAAEDIGRSALGIFRRGDEFIGRTVSVAGDHLSGDEFAAEFSKAWGETVVYRPFTHDQFRALGIPMGDEIGNMFQFYVEATDAFVGARDLNLVRELNPRLESFPTWLAKNAAQIQH